MQATKWEDINYVTKMDEIIDTDSFLDDINGTLDTLREKVERIRVYIAINTRDSSIVNKNVSDYTVVLEKIRSIRKITDNGFFNDLNDVYDEIIDRLVPEETEEKVEVVEGPELTSGSDMPFPKLD